MDAKAPVNIGAFARGGKSRVPTKALDHDFQPDEKVTPVGILIPSTDELFVYGVTSHVTSDCLMDRLQQWWAAVRPRYGRITTLLINLDNGPENHSRRTQFMQRLVDFVQQTGLTVQLAYYPPYHSKYNPIERCWGVLEQHWNGSLLELVAGDTRLYRIDDVARHPSGCHRRHPQLSHRRQAHQSGDGGH